MISTMKFSFPNPVNETSARIVAGGVVIMAALTLLSGQQWLTIPLFYGFLARVCYGPKFSPLGLLSTKVITPRINKNHRMVPGPPKRFAQAIGLAVSSVALAGFIFNTPSITTISLSILIVAASLEAFFAICLGCIMFSWLIRLGVIPEKICVACTNINMQYLQTSGNESVRTHDLHNQ